MEFTPPIELRAVTFNPFSWLDFREFIIKNKVIATAVGLVIGKQLENLTESFFSAFIFPLFNRDADGDGENDYAKLFDYQIKWSGMTFTIGKLIETTIKFAIIMYILFFVSRLLHDLID
jgi:large-conductance mechanosensitive channel